jgi:hypothetical protein
MSKDSKDTKAADGEKAKALQLKVLELKEKLGEAVDADNVEAMTLDQLTELVRLLASRVAEKDAAPPPPPPGAPAPTAVVTSGTQYFVADGRRSISCKRGVLGPNEEITDRDVSGGREQLEYLVKRGHLVKR